MKQKTKTNRWQLLKLYLIDQENRLAEVYHLRNAKGTLTNEDKIRLESAVFTLQGIQRHMMALDEVKRKELKDANVQR